MKSKLENVAIEQLFGGARTVNRFIDRPVSDATLRELYELLKWGPTAVNSQPGRYVFIRSREEKERLVPALAGGNVEKTLHSPVTIIVAADKRFFDHLPDQFKGFDARPLYEANPELARETALRNSSLQGAYLIMAARALGLDCGPMSGFDAAMVDAAFFPGGEWMTNFLVNLGHGDQQFNFPRGPRLDFDAVARVL